MKTLRRLAVVATLCAPAGLSACDATGLTGASAVPRRAHAVQGTPRTDGTTAALVDSTTNRNTGWAGSGY